MQTRRLIPVMIGLAVLADRADAQPRVSEAANKLFEEGRALRAAGRHEEACKRFSASYDLQASPGITLNYAEECFERTGDLRRAWQLYEEAARKSEQEHDYHRAGQVRERANQVRDKLVTVVVTVVDPKIDGLGVAIGSESLTVRAKITERWSPGEIDVSASAPDRAPFRKTYHANPGQTLEVTIPVLAPAEVADEHDDASARHAHTAPVTPAPAAAAARVAEREPPAAADELVASDHVVTRRDRNRVRLAYYVGGAGGGALLFTAGFGIAAALKHDAAGCQDVGGVHECKDGAAEHAANLWASAANISAVVTGGLVGTALVLYLTAPSEHLAVRPTASGDSVGISLAGRF